MAAVSFTNDTPTRSLLAGNAPFLGAYEWIQSVTVGSLGASSVTFSEIPQGYRHLQIRGVARNTASGTSFDNASITLNGDTGSNYSAHILYGDGGGSAASAGNASVAASSYSYYTPRAGSTSNVFGGFVVDILDYSNTVKNKTLRCLGGVDLNGSGRVFLSSASWMSTAVVSSLTLGAGSGSLAQYSTFSLYGIR